MSLVAVVEPDDVVRLRLVRALQDAGLSAVEAADGLAALRTTFAAQPQAIILNARVPGVDGMELVRLLSAACDIPIIVMVADASSRMTVRLLDGGADDVIDRGATPLEFVARVRSAIRHAERRVITAAATSIVRTGDLVVDRNARTVTKREVPVPLSRTEYRLLDALAARLGQVASHHYLLSTAWGDAYVDDVHYLRVYVGYLRRKLEDDPASPVYLLNEWGVGYRMAALPVVSAGTVPVRAAMWGDSQDRSRVAAASA